MRSGCACLSHVALCFLPLTLSVWLAISKQRIGVYGEDYGCTPVLPCSSVGIAMKEASLDARSSVSFIPNSPRKFTEKNRRPRRRDRTSAVLYPDALLQKCPLWYGTVFLVAVILLPGFVSPVQAQPETRSLQKVYWSYNQNRTGTIYRSDPDGTNVDSMFTSNEIFNGIAVDASRNRIYWGAAGKIYSMRLNGGDVRTEVTQFGTIVDVVLIHNWVYFTNYDLGTINRLNPTRGTVEVLVDQGVGKQSADINPARHLSSIEDQSASKSGSAINRPWGIAVQDDPTEQNIFWTEEGANRVMMADLDGRNVRALQDSGLDHPRGITFDGRALFINPFTGTLFSKDPDAALDVVPDRLWSCDSFCTGLSVTANLIDVEKDYSSPGNDHVFYVTDNRTDRIWKVTRRPVGSSFVTTQESLFERPANGSDGPVGIGLLIDDGSWANPNLAVSLSGPDRILPDVSGEPTPNPFVMTATIDNIGGSTVTNVSATLTPKDILHVEGPSTQAVGDLLPGQQVTVVWNIGISSSDRDKTVRVSVSVNSANATRVGDTHPVDVFALGLLPTNLTEKIYWMESPYFGGNPVAIMRSEPDGSADEEIFSVADIAYALIVDYGYAYFMGNNRIFRSKLNGRERETLFVDTEFSGVTDRPVELKKCGNALYWNGWAASGSGIYRFNLDGSDGVETLVQGQTSSIGGIALTSDCSQVYWVVYGTGSAIRRADIDGSNEEVIVERDFGNYFDVEIDSNKLFYTDGGRIYRATLSGADETLVQGNLPNELNGPAGDIELDPVAEQIYFGKSFFSAPWNFGILRVDYDGSDLAELFESTLISQNKYSLALKPAASGAGGILIDIISPAEIGRNDDGDLSPNPFTVRAHIDPVAETIADASAKLWQLSSLSIVGGDAVVEIGKNQKGRTSGCELGSSGRRTVSRRL